MDSILFMDALPFEPMAAPLPMAIMDFGSGMLDPASTPPGSLPSNALLMFDGEHKDPMDAMLTSLLASVADDSMRYATIDPAAPESCGCGSGRAASSSVEPLAVPSVPITPDSPDMPLVQPQNADKPTETEGKIVVEGQYPEKPREVIDELNKGDDRTQ